MLSTRNNNDFMLAHLLVLENALHLLNVIRPHSHVVLADGHAGWNGDGFDVSGNFDVRGMGGKAQSIKGSREEELTCDSCL